MLHRVMPFLHQNLYELCAEIFLHDCYLFWVESHSLVSLEIAFFRLLCLNRDRVSSQLSSIILTYLCQHLYVVFE